MKKQNGETLAEALIALTAFGILLSGITDFMATNLKFVAWTKQRDNLMFNVQTLVNSDDVWSKILAGNENNASYDWDANNKKLTVKINNYSMDFTLP